MSDKMLFFSVGSGSMLLSIAVTIYTSIKLSKWQRVEGAVIELVEVRDPEGGSIAPVVRFTNREDFSTVTFQEGVSGPIQHKIGERVEVVYDPKRPSRASIAGWRPYFMALFFLFIACMLLGLGAVQR
jgi:hypothetical protein